MAELKQTSGSFSLPLKKKPPSFNNNGVTASFKHIYDDVFGSSSSSKVKTSSVFMEDDYAEIFGSSKSNNGSWSISYSSVPILELPRDKGVGFRGERVDYGAVFGGFDNGGCFGLPDGEELFDQLKKKAKTSPSNNLPRNQGRTMESTSLETPSQSFDEQPSTNGFRQSYDDLKHLEPENGKVTVRNTSKPKKAAHVRVYSFHEPVMNNDPPDTDSSIGGKLQKHYKHASLDLGAQSSNGTGLQKVSGMSVSNSVDSMNGTCQPSHAATNGFYQSFDNTKDSEYKVSELSINRTSGETHTPDVHPIHESNHSSHELGPTQDVHPIHKSNHSFHELGPTQEALSSKTSALTNEPQPTNDVNMVKEQKRHSRNTSLDLGSKQNDNCDVVFQKPCGLTESTSVDNSHESCEASGVAGPSNVVKDDSSVDCGKVKKKGRRYRVASVDLGDYKHSSDHDDGLKRKPRLSGSYSFDASHDPGAARVNVQPSMMYPSSSLPRFFPVESRYKISENSSGKRSQKNWVEDAGDSLPSLAEELDVNSEAAISAAALQRAIEEAELSIRLAKEFLEREGQGSTKVRFKDTLRVRVAKKNRVVNEVKEVKRTKMHEWCPPVVDSELKEHCSPLERKHAVEVAQRAAVFEDKKFVKDGKLADGGDAKVSNSITEDCKREGEWEAAKHLNQLISGVKNKLASFMSWQTETEKKVAAKEMELQQHPEEIEHDLKDHEIFERKQTQQNEVISTSSGEAMHGKNEVRFSSETLEPEENGVVSSFDVKQDKAGNKLDTIPDTVAPSSANFQFFAFRNQKVCDSDTEVEEREHLEIRDFVMVNGQDQVIDVVEVVYIPSEVEEASQKDSDDKCVTQDSKTLDDMSRTSDKGISDTENDKTIEEPCSLAGHNEKDFSVEEVLQGNVIWNDELCYVSGETVEMVEGHYCMAGHDKKEPPFEEYDQDYMSGKSHLGSVNEEYDEIVEQPYSFSGHEEKGLPHVEGTQDDMYSNTHIGSGSEENEMMAKELCTQAGHERKFVVLEEDNNGSSTEEFEDEPIDHCNHCGNTSERIDEDIVGEVPEETKNQHENVELLKETWNNFEFKKGDYECQENNRDQRETNYIEEFPAQTFECEDIKQVENQTDLIEETAENVNVEASCIASADEGCKQNEDLSSSKAEESCELYVTSSKVEEAVYCAEEHERMMDVASTSEPEVNIQSSASAQKASELLEEEPPLSVKKSSEFIGEKPLESTQNPGEFIAEEPDLSTETEMELDRNEIKEGLNGTIGTVQRENVIPLDSEVDLSSGQKDFDVKAVDPESQYKLDKQTEENLRPEEFDTMSDLEAERSGVEAFHRRRRWFDNGANIAIPEQPSILEGKGVDLEIDQEVLDESELAGSVEIHADKQEGNTADVTTARDANASYNQDSVRANVETTPTRRKWFVQEGKPEPVSLFEDIKVNLEVPLESMNESLPHNISGNCLDKLNAKSGESLNPMKCDVAINGERGKQSGEAAPRRKRWFESGERVGPSQQVKINEDVGLTVEIDQDSKAKVDECNIGKHDSRSIPHEKNDVHDKVEPEKEYHRDQKDDMNRRGKEKEKEKIAVERAIREARERAFAEAKERARRDAADRPNVEARPKVAAGVQEKLEKASSEATSSSDKASVEAKLKAERAAVERATAEARERAWQKALSEKASQRSREQAGRYSMEKNSSLDPKKQSSDSSSSNVYCNAEKFEGAYVESAQRRKARLERQTRTMERAATALEEKNRRDLLAQKEQAANNMMANSLDAEVKRWCNGKEGNLRALLSTLQYVLGPESGWQPVSLTDLVASTAVRKAYKKATLCVHPDKLQQRGATLQQKYISEKVFDLLKDAWSKFNPDEH